MMTATAKPQVLTKAQTRAIENFVAWIQASQLERNPAYGDTITVNETELTDYGKVWLKIETDMVNLGEGNFLRFVSKQHWFVQIGKRGAIVAYSYPKSFRQFRGRKAFNIFFK